MISTFIFALLSVASGAPAIGSYFVFVFSDSPDSVLDAIISSVTDSGGKVTMRYRHAATGFTGTVPDSLLVRSNAQSNRHA